MTELCRNELHEKPGPGRCVPCMKINKKRWEARNPKHWQKYKDKDPDAYRARRRENYYIKHRNDTPAVD